ncbi:MAG: vanadium-dependent haloperoxidase [Opitutaceae bacterium]
MNRSPLALSFLRRLLASAAIAIAATCGALADVVTDWNVAMTDYSEKLPPPGLPPFLEARAYAMAHIAMNEAVAEHGNNRGAHAGAAIAQAAHDVLIAVLPGGTAKFDTVLAAHLAAVPDGEAKTRGIQLGAEKAAAMLAARANDGATTAEGPYTPGTNPGDYRFTAPFDGPPFNGYAAVPKWGKVKPFALKRGDQFRAPPPYKVTDLAYTFDLNEIKGYGSANSAVRSVDQTRIALFWYENSSFGWNRIARLIAAQHAQSLAQRAQLYASLNAAVADAYIASIDSKYAYNFWRPITAIQLAASDGNDATAADPAWQPLLLTPPIPDYPSGHAAAGGAAAAVLISVFGDEQTFTLESTMAQPFPAVQPRAFHRISDAAKENAYSRMLVGIHFRLACEVGLAQGLDVGTWAAQHPALIKGR